MVIFYSMCFFLLLKCAYLRLKLYMRLPLVAYSVFLSDSRWLTRDETGGQVRRIG